MSNTITSAAATEVTAIRNADWVIAWDAEKKCHYYMRDADVVFQGDMLIYVGPGFSGRVDRVIDGRGRMIMPGLVNIHSHLSGGSTDKGIFDDTGAKALYGHALYSHSPLLRMEEEDIPPTAVSALCELLKSGVTTTVDISRNYPGWIDLMGSSGMRVVLGMSFRQARWVNVGNHRVDYEWDDQAGWDGLEQAVDIADAAEGHPSGRLSGLIMPAQADTCSPELFREAFRQAELRNLPFQTHASQTMVEFNEMIRRYGAAPVQWLDGLGVLSERTTLGHCLFTDHHSWSPLRTQNDLPLLAERGVTVAHCPTVFGRTGMTMQTAGRYLREGVHLGIGTDSYPYNMLEELRHGLVYSRITGGDVFDISTADVFHAATVGGARALLRDDIGRLAPGAKADLVIVDTTHPLMRPVRDPLRSLVFVAAERAVKDVFVDGRQLVADGEVITMDYRTNHGREDDIQQRMVSRVPETDPSGRNLDEIAPRCFHVSPE